MELKDDVLRCKFTAWMQVVVKRAKIDYIRCLKRHYNEISIEDNQLSDKLIAEPINIIESADEFEFDNEKLANLFMKLAPKKQKVLKMLFVNNMEPEEVAEQLHCTLQHVYNMRSLALKELKSKMQSEEY